MEPQAVVVAEEKADEVEVDEDEEPEAVVREPLFETAPLLKENKSGAPAAAVSLRLENCGLRGATLEVLGASPSPFSPSAAALAPPWTPC